MIKDSLDFLFYGFAVVVIGVPFSLYCKCRDKLKNRRKKLLKEVNR